MPCTAEDEWLAAHGVTHGHCPLGCSHPQPFVHEGEPVCGCCWFRHGQRTPMVPCDEEIC